jgi:predicted membrane channel-forming protein YqfA (hemolysin III family)
MPYKYTILEKYLISLITGVSNLALLPTLKLLYLRGLYYHFFLGLFTILSSFMYHSTEYTDLIILMEQKKWHYLDNIGSICSLISIIIQFKNDNNYYEELNSNIICFLFVMIVQTKDPWDIINTVVPLILAIFYLLFDLFRKGSNMRINESNLKKGLFIFSLGLICFYFGLDNENDYLRLIHGFWHFFIGLATFYLWQVKIREKESSFGLKEIILLKTDFNMLVFPHFKKA